MGFCWGFAGAKLSVAKRPVRGRPGLATCKVDVPTEPKFMQLPNPHSFVMTAQRSWGELNRAMGESRQRSRSAIWATALLIIVSACTPNADPTSGLGWAYPHGSTSTFEQPLGPGPFRVPDSQLVLTHAQMEGAQGPIDWHPQDHPPAPRVVGGPERAGLTPCAECHLLNGAGFPAAADLAGLPADYIVEQVTAFRDGTRRSAARGQPNTAEMIKAAKAVSPAELRDAAAYFSQLPRSRWVKVVETAAAPRTYPDKYGWLNAAPGGGTEPTGDRIVELSGDLRRMMLGDDHVFMIDYAPPGAIDSGRRIVMTGGGAGMPCRSCHGARMEGVGTVPPIAGRPAGYIARTLWDIRIGARANPEITPMKAVSRGLSAAEIRDVSAYLASLSP